MITNMRSARLMAILVFRLINLCENTKKLAFEGLF